MNRVKATLALLGVTASMLFIAAPAQATECEGQRPCTTACQVNKDIYIDDSGNVGWGGSGRPIDCYV
jgi:hypothetical protein